jgi:chitin disaccharide deacetylase
MSLGLHVDLGEWAYREAGWVPVYEVASTEDRGAVADEVNRQFDTFCRLVGRAPTHLDSHQHVHRAEPVHSVLVELSQALGVPLRDYSRLVRYCGDFYGQYGAGTPYPEGISVGRLIDLLTALPAGLTELGCHPGDGGDVDSMYRGERAREVETLCDPRVRAVLVADGIELRSFHRVSEVQ